MLPSERIKELTEARVGAFGAFFSDAKIDAVIQYLDELHSAKEVEMK